MGGVSRTIPRGEVEGLDGGLQAQAQSGEVGGLAGGSPGPSPGVEGLQAQAWGVQAQAGGVSQHSLRQTSPQQTATAADSTHPTGMHSCYDIKCIKTLTVYRLSHHESFSFCTQLSETI